MASSSESGTGRGGLLGSIGRLFGGGRKHDASDAAAGDADTPAYPAVTEPAESAKADEQAAAEAPETLGSEEDEELVLGPSLKASEAAAEAAPEDADHGLVLGAAGSEEPAEAPGSKTGDAELEEEEDILARLRAMRDEQGEAGDAAEQQQAAPSEDAWAASFGAAGDEPAQAPAAEAGPSSGFGGWQDDTEEDDTEEEAPAEPGPARWTFVEDADTGAEEREGAEEGWPREAGPTGEAVPLFGMRDSEDAAAAERPEAEETAGELPESVAAEERETGAGASEREPAAGDDETVTEEADAPRADASAAEDTLAEVAEPEAAEPEPEAEAEVEPEPPFSTSEAEEPGAEPTEGADALAENVKAGDSTEPDAAPVDAGEAEAVEEADQAEEAPSAVAEEDAVADEDRTVPAGAEVVTLGAAAASEDAQGPTRTRSDEAAGLDEAQVEEIVRRLIREELEGELGERLSANIRRVVREEVSRALSRDR